MSDIKDKAKQVLGTLAPMLGSALGGPFGGVAGKILADALNVEPGRVQDLLVNVTPEHVEKIKAAELDFEMFMEDAGIRREELSVDDRKDARLLAREMGLVAQYVLGTVYTVGYFVLLYGVFSGSLSIPAESTQVVTILLGVLSAGQTQIFNFFFGSSAGSQQKTQLIKDK